MSNTIRLPCSAALKDYLHLKDDSSSGLERVEVRTVTTEHENPEQSTYIDLATDDVRALFNWLGVWLHGGNRA